MIIASQYEDEMNIGKLETDKFKKVLKEFKKLALSITDINRIVRYIPKVDGNKIDFYNFLRQIDRIDVVTTSQEMVGDIYEFAEKLSDYLKEKKITIQEFLKQIRRFALMLNIEEISKEGDVTVGQVTQYLLRNVFKLTAQAKLDLYVNELDVDCDGFVTEDDVRTFLEKYNYFEQVFFQNTTATRDYLKGKQYNGLEKTLGTKGLFPVDTLPEARVNKILRDLHKQLEIRALSYETFFRMLDEDNDGWITIQEFSKNIDKVNSSGRDSSHATPFGTDPLTYFFIF